MTKDYKLASIEQIIEDAKNAKMFIIVDDENRENEGDLVIPGEFADAEAINFMAKYGRGLICLALNEARVKELKIPLMSPFNNSRHGTAFTISIEAAKGVSTGISASDRAKTIADAINPELGAEDIVSPGHVFPLVARNGGVLTRAGHTEAAVDISVLAGLNPSGVICEIMNDDGTMARLPDLIEFAKEHKLNIASIADLIAYRRRFENLVYKESSQIITTEYGEFELLVYISKVEYAEHIVIRTKDIDYTKPVLVRMHSQNILSDMIGIKELGGDKIFSNSLAKISKEGGVIVILRSPKKDRVTEALKKLNNEKKGSDSVIRDYGTGAQILLDMGVRQMRLLTKSQKSVIGLESFGLEIVDFVSVK